MSVTADAAPWTLLLVGDVMLGRLLNGVLEREGSAYPWGDTLPLFREADLRICNLECVISDRGEPWSATPKVFHFRTHARNLECLRAAGIDAVSLANNHVLDYGVDALSECLQLLDRAGIGRAGAGMSREAAVRPARLSAGDRSVALISFTDNEPAWAAGEASPGIFHVPVRPDAPEAGELFDAVEAAAGEADVVVVAAHWGPNWGERPEPSHPAFGRALVDAGADVVVGHSPHVVRGVELHRARPILYSAGDFVDDYAVDRWRRNDRSFIFLLRFEGSRPARLDLHPTVIRKFQARRAEPPDAAEIVHRMIGLCEALGTEARWDQEAEALRVPIG